MADGKVMILVDWLHYQIFRSCGSDGDNEQRNHLESHELKSERDCYDISLTQGKEERISPALHARMATQLLRDIRYATETRGSSGAERRGGVRSRNLRNRGTKANVGW